MASNGWSVPVGGVAKGSVCPHPAISARTSSVGPGHVNTPMPMPTSSSPTATAQPRIDPSTGFDDFVLHPYVPEELYGRIRALEWRRSEFATEERHKVAGIVVDASNETVIPGLIEIHTHLSKDYGEALGRAFLAWGITTVRNPATNTYETLEDREAVLDADHELTLPR